MEQYRNLAFFSRRDSGMCVRLRGKVLVELIYIGDRSSVWTKAEKDSFGKKFREAMEYILEQAQKSGVELTIFFFSDEYTYDGVVDQNKSSDVFSSYIRQRGMSETTYCATRKADYDADEVAVILVMEKQFRAYAKTTRDTEFSVISGAGSMRTICHELLHCFGAVDLYFPYYVRAAALRHFKGSIMCTNRAMQIDPLTRYLIGWTDRLDDKTAKFLEETGDYTRGRYCEALDLEWTRGHEDDIAKEVTVYNSVSQLESRAGRYDIWAQFLLGCCYREGVLKEKNLTKAEEYFRSCGRTGLPIGSFAQLELMLLRGKLTKSEKQQILDIFEYCGRENIWQESLRLLCMYEGIVFEKEERETARRISNEYNNLGQRVPADLAGRALPMYRAADRASSKLPQLNRVVKGIIQRYEQAMRCGDPALQVLMGRLLLQGKYVREDVRKAMELYSKAADNGSYGACMELVRCYREGDGMPRDMAQEQYWRNRADQCAPDTFSLLLEQLH